MAKISVKATKGSRGTFGVNAGKTSSSSKSSSSGSAYQRGGTDADAEARRIAAGNQINAGGSSNIYNANSPTRSVITNKAVAPAKVTRPKFPSFEQFSTPQMKVLEQRILDKYKPEWQRYTYDPAMVSYGNNLAAGGGNMLGGAQNNYRDYTDQLNRGFEEDAQSIRDALLQKIREDYNRRLYENNASPTYLDSILLNY